MTTLFDSKGASLPGHYAPATKGAPGVVLVHEMWGLNAHMRSVATRFANAGFDTFAPDLYRGVSAADEANAARLMDGLDWSAALADLEAARAALAARHPKVAVVGFCLGGALCLAGAARFPFDACVPFYGIPGDAYDVTKIRGPVLGHFAQDDEWCTPARVDALEQKLDASKVPHQLFRYDARHAFFNDTNAQRYSAEHAQAAWERTVNFLQGALR